MIYILHLVVNVLKSIPAFEILSVEHAVEINT